MDRRQKARLNRFIRIPDRRLERRDHVSDDVFRGVVQQKRKPALAAQSCGLTCQYVREQAMLGNRENMRAFGLAVPARNACKAMGDVFDLDIERRGVEQIEPPSGEHALPDTERLRASAAPALHQTRLARAAWR